MNRFLSELARFERVKTAQSVATAAIDTDSVDLAAGEGFDSVLFVVLWGTITDGTPLVKGQQSSDDGSADDFSDLIGTSVVAAVGDDNKMSILDIRRPSKRYVRAEITRGGATGAVVDGVIAILYDSKTEPVDQSADVAAIEQHVSPAEGTA